MHHGHGVYLASVCGWWCPRGDLQHGASPVYLPSCPAFISLRSALTFRSKFYLLCVPCFPLVFPFYRFIYILTSFSFPFFFSLIRLHCVLPKINPLSHVLLLFHPCSLRPHFLSICMAFPTPPPPPHPPPLAFVSPRPPRLP